VRAGLSAELQSSERAQRARDLLAACVHCGFCTATCPTYRLLGDELDSPRGRIYLVKQVLEGADAGASSLLHLDRCLTCRACETACPSGVRYGELSEIGRELLAGQVARPAGARLARWLIARFVPSAAFAWAVAVSGLLARLLPASIARGLPRRLGRGGLATAPAGSSRRVLLLEGCAQGALRPGINAATSRVLARAGIGATVARGAGCCGALRAHLGEHEAGLEDMRRNVDAWWPLVSGEGGAGPVEAIVMTASGCGSMVKEYGERLAHDPGYAHKALRVSALTRDLSELLPELLPALREALAPDAAPGPRLALHVPCTLQHGQRCGRTLAQDLCSLGLEAREAPTEAGFCCGSAGAYSLLQPEIARALRQRKLAALESLEPQCIASANIGCIGHLQGATDRPVRHWIEVVDERLRTHGR